MEENPTGNETPSLSARHFSAWLFLLCLLPLGILAWDIWQYPFLISGGLAMRIVAAGLISQGETPYVDFWDWTQPIVFYLLQLLTQVSNFLASLNLPVIPAAFIPWCLFSLIIFALLLILQICRRAKACESSLSKQEAVSDFAFICCLSLSLTALISRFDFGELQYVLLFAVAPWLFLRWLAHQQVILKGKVATILSVSIGSFAGLIACFDLPFVLVFLALELALSLQSQKWRTILSLEWLSFLSVYGANLVVLMLFKEPLKTAFWQWTMGLKLLNYSILDPTLVAPLSTPNRVDIIYCLLAAGLMVLLSLRSSGFAPFVSLMCAGLGLYMLEGQGFSHDFILTIFALVLVFSSATISMLRSISRRVSSESSKSKAFYAGLVVAVLTASLIVWRSLELDRSRLQDLVSANITKGNLPLNMALEKTSKVNESVTVLSPYVEPAYPLMLFSGRKPGGYLLWGRPLWLFNWLSENSRLTGATKDFHDHTWSNLEAEIAQHRTDMFVAEDDKVLGSFDRAKFFGALRKSYSEVDTTGEFFSIGNHQPHEFCGSNSTYRFFVKRNERGN